VTINRHEVRDSLHPMANDELDEVVGAYFADPDLCVWIITGVGEQALCAGNDVVYFRSGKPMWMPKNGFGGLTRRRGMTKPVIAAANPVGLGVLQDRPRLPSRRRRRDRSGSLSAT
jgi:acetyl-CoA C-acetyltransferase